MRLAAAHKLFFNMSNAFHHGWRWQRQVSTYVNDILEVAINRTIAPHIFLSICAPSCRKSFLISTHITRATFGKESSNRQRFIPVLVLKETMKLLPLLWPADLFPSMSFVITSVDGSRSRMDRAQREMDAVLDEINCQALSEENRNVLLRIQEKGNL